MRVLEHAVVAAACGASAAISTLVLFLCSAWLLSSASLALVTMTALGSGLIALMEFKETSTPASPPGSAALGVSGP